MENISLSKKILNLAPSATLEINRAVERLQAMGVEVISLAVGEPDFNTPDHVKKAAIDAINNNYTKYTNSSGILKLREAVQKKFLRENKLDYQLDEIIIGVGAKQVIYNLFMATLEADDEVIIPSPYWVSYPEIVRLVGAKPIIVSTDYKNNFKLTKGSLAASITPKTKWLILNSPNNPTGSVYSYEELMELASTLLEYPHVNIMTDDIYEHITFKGYYYNILTVCPSLKDRVFVVNGVSKAYSMTGWRIGYGAGHKSIIKAMGILQSQTIASTTSISQYAAIAALDGPQDFVTTNTEIFRLRRDTAVEILQKTDLLEFNVPDGAFYIFISINNMLGKKNLHGEVIDNEYTFAKLLLEYKNVAVVPGGGFGAENYFRISYALDIERLKEACSRIIDFCNSLK